MSSEDVALFDLDGTLAAYEDALERDLSKLLAPGEALSMDDGLPHVQARMRLVKSQVGWWRNLGRLRDGFEILSEAERVGFSIHILTKGPASNHVAWSEKVSWSRENVPGALVSITEDKGLVYGKVLVDDFPDYMLRWLKWRPRGLGIMPARRINEGFSHPNVVRYDGTNMAEVLEKLEAAKKRSASGPTIPDHIERYG